jgi:hypothetical protein
MVLHKSYKHCDGFFFTPHLRSMEKIKDNEMKWVILNDLHIVMYMPFELSENIETFMNRGKNKDIESFTQHLLNDSWIQYFWVHMLFSTWCVT